MFDFFKKKKDKNEEICYDGICPYEIQPISEQYIGPCDVCGYMSKEMIDKETLRCCCGHKDGCKSHIKDLNSYNFRTYYEIPKNCPLKEK